MEKLTASMLKVLTLGRKRQLNFSFKLANCFSFKLKVIYSLVTMLQNMVGLFFHKTLVDSLTGF